MKTYIVTATPKHIGYTQYGSNAWETEVTAKTKAEAIKYAKADARRDYVFDRFDGAISWKAEEA